MQNQGREREFLAVGAEDQLAALAARASDSRPSMTTPWPGLNDYLHRGGVHPGELVVLGGRKGTRKSTVMLNWAMHLLHQQVPVGLITLDESLPMYVAKLMSVLSRHLSPELIEDEWDGRVELREEYESIAKNLTMTAGVRPTIEKLTEWLDWSDMESSARPRVVFIDYTSLLVHYRTRETERVPRLFEELQVWTRDNDLVTVALHQAGRTDEGVSKKYHGDTPMTSEGLLYGGEQQADILLSTYRPALNTLGNLDREMAEVMLGETFDETKWQDAVARVRRFQKSTMLQLLKNRPSVKGECFEGVELISPNQSQVLVEKGSDDRWED